MGSKVRWDNIGSNEQYYQWVKEWGSQMYRALKEGGSALVFGGKRTYHWLTQALKDAGFQHHDNILWVYWCVTEDTRILTKNGIKNIDELTINDNVATINFTTETVEYQNPMAINIQPFSGNIFSIVTENGIDQRVTPNHRVVIKQRETGNWLTTEARFLRTFNIRGEIPVINGAKMSTSPLKKIDVIHYEGRVWCPSTLNSNFIAERDGKFFITGNSGFPKGKYNLKPASEFVFHGIKNPDNKPLSEIGFTFHPDTIQIQSKDGKSIYPANIFDIPKASKNERTVKGKVTNKHPTIKPVKLLKKLLKLTTNQGDLVVDPFVGSGSTAVAAKESCRNFIGNDLNDVDVAQQRVKLTPSGCNISTYNL